MCVYVYIRGGHAWLIFADHNLRHCHVVSHAFGQAEVRIALSVYDTMHVCMYVGVLSGEEDASRDGPIDASMSCA